MGKRKKADDIGEIASRAMRKPKSLRKREIRALGASALSQIGHGTLPRMRKRGAKAED